MQPGKLVIGLFLYPELSTSAQILQNNSSVLQFVPECIHWGRRGRERESAEIFFSMVFFSVIQFIFSCRPPQGAEISLPGLTWETPE